MPYTKIATFIGALVIIAAALVGVAYIAQKNPPEAEEAKTVINGAGYTIEEEKLFDTPNIHRGITFSDSIPENVRVLIQAKADTDIATLEKDKSNAGAWLDLALWYKSANDYEGAREIWEFVTKAAPNDTTAFDNLGRMYHFDLQEYAKAESYFKQSLAINPKVSTPYLELFELYTLSYKQSTTAAEDIIAKAEVQFPAEAAFPYTLGGHYRTIGNYAAARAEYSKALALARAANNMQLVGSINADIATLP